VVVAGLLGVAGLMAYAAWRKGQAPDEFLGELRLHAILPESVMWVASRAIVWAEWALAGILALSTCWAGGRPIALGALVAFLVSASSYLAAVAIERGTHLTCGCLGGGQGSFVGAALVRNLGLLTLAIALGALTARSRPRVIR
jgi:hypothetical protein